MDKNNSIWLAFDADSAGRKIQRAILANAPDDIKSSSDQINLGNEIVDRWAKEFGGICYSSGGDQGLYWLPKESLEHVQEMVADYKFATGLTVTVGVGQDPSQAGQALMVGKLRGKDQIVNFDDSVAADYCRAQAEANAVDPQSAEQKKLGEAYMTPEQKSEGEGLEVSSDQPAQTDDHHDCPYCAQLDGVTEHSCGENCPYCEEYDAKQAQGNDEEHSHDNCPYCQEYDQQNSGNGCDCPHCAEYDAKKAQGQDPTQVGNPGSEAEQDDPESAQTIETILQHLDQEAPLNPEDAAAAPAGDAVEDGVSRPEGFDSNTPGDMGLSEENEQEQGPDLTDVLQGGLDEHADQIAREKVVGMVSEALEGFKASKDVLEKAKEQAPQLYQASIMMLKAMIEMAKMIGLGPSAQSTAEPVEQPSSNAPAAPPEGAAQAPQQ